MINIELLPNWHPVLVHFTIGLFITSALLFIINLFAARYKWSKNFLNAAYINLWLGALITVLTVITGWQAYVTVFHNEQEHVAMTDHRNWALLTVIFWFYLAFWSKIKISKKSRPNAFFIVLVLIATIMLTITGFKGSELVYRYGIGVAPTADINGIRVENNNHSH